MTKQTKVIERSNTSSHFFFPKKGVPQLGFLFTLFCMGDWFLLFHSLCRDPQMPAFWYSVPFNFISFTLSYYFFFFFFQLFCSSCCILVFVFLLFDVSNKNSVGAWETFWCLAHFLMKHSEEFISGTTCREMGQKLLFSYGAEIWSIRKYQDLFLTSQTINIFDSSGVLRLAYYHYE